VQSIITQHKPDDVAVEKVFVNVNPQSTLLLGQARGAAITAAVLAGVTVHEYTALQVKQAVGPRQGSEGAGAGDGQTPAQARRHHRPTPPTRSPPPSPTRTRARVWARWRQNCSPSAKSGSAAGGWCEQLSAENRI
jgi:hypothetical protein